MFPPSSSSFAQPHHRSSSAAMTSDHCTNLGRCIDLVGPENFGAPPPLLITCKCISSFHLRSILGFRPFIGVLAILVLFPPTLIAFRDAPRPALQKPSMFSVVRHVICLACCIHHCIFCMASCHHAIFFLNLTKTHLNKLHGFLIHLNQGNSHGDISL